MESRTGYISAHSGTRESPGLKALLKMRSDILGCLPWCVWKGVFLGMAKLEAT